MIRTIVGIAWTALSQVGVETGHAGAEDGEEGREAEPEEEPEGAEAEAGALRKPADSLGRLGEDVAGAGGVVVRHQDEPGGGVRAIAGGDHVLGDAAKEQGADEVEAGVEVEVGRGRCEQDECEADRGLDRREQAAGDPQQRVDQVDQGVLGVGEEGLDVRAAADGA